MPGRAIRNPLSVILGKPMTIEQMSDWAKTVTDYTPNEVAKALHTLNARVITIRREQ